MTIYSIERPRHKIGAIRDDTRGLAMTEGVVVIPFFILIWMALLAITSLYHARLEAQVEAHNIAFSGAMGGKCDGIRSKSANTVTEDVRREIDTAGANQGLGQLSSQADKSVEMESGASASSGGSSLFDWSMYLTEATRTVNDLPLPLGGPSKTMHGQAKLLCNMRPKNGLGDLFYDLLESWFS